MKKVITYGTYDLFHQGHYNLLKRAKDLGDYLIVGVTTDNFDLERGKMNTCNNVMERIEAVKATGLADSQVRVISAINCISIVIVPSPLHSSHLPPSVL